VWCAGKGFLLDNLFVSIKVNSMMILTAAFCLVAMATKRLLENNQQR
jgi:hypothetical protein